MPSATPPALPALPKRHTLQEFIHATTQKDHGQGLFELETERLLELNLNGKVHTKMGSMVAYHGQVKFTRETLLSRGVGNLLKKAVSGEGARITDAEGVGSVYLADAGKKISVIELSNESIVVNGNDILAFEPTIQYDIKMMKRVAAMLSGGLFNIRLQGSGLVAITSHYEPRTLIVEPGKPVVTDPNATVAWSGSLEPQIKTDVSLKSFLGRGSGESFQMLFEGSGFVTIQPYEEVAYQASS
ncbi:AIM24 family protein [Oceaniferula marina]|nr:AIM24 family protein [Oceaniferula marina]